MNRRRSIQLLACSLGGVFLMRCGMRGSRPFTVKLSGASAERGHRLRAAHVFQPIRSQEVEVIIVGAGVAGLSTARTLRSNGVDDLLVLDLEDRAGGNARSGSNAYGAFPLGAHYLPVPEPKDEPLLQFLRECGVITGTAADGSPIYNEEHLCGDPHERLFHRGQWRSGLRPRSGQTNEEEQQFVRFEERVAEFGLRKGTDGRWAFAIPVDDSSMADDTADVRALDDVTFAAWLSQEGFDTQPLMWYLDYACMDDLGAPASQVSAWAGLHYFAARRGHGSNAETGSILTWPEGNGFLVNGLLRSSADRVRTGTLVRSVGIEDDHVQVDVSDMATGEDVRYRASHVVLAVPQFVVARLLGGEHVQRSSGMEYAPWIVVNLTLDRAPIDRGGEPMAWDNVLFGSASLGYVNAGHQRLDRAPGMILTHYRALTGRSPRQAREQASGVEVAQWVEDAVQELERVHPDLRDRLVEAEVAIWGHGMIVPVPGTIHGPQRRTLRDPLADRIHFAHSDLSGISLFEEAFHHGLRAAREVLDRRKA